MDPVPVGLKFSAGRPQPISGSQLLSTPGLLPDLMGGISWGERGPRWLFLCRLLSKHLVDSYDMQGCGKERRASPDRRLGRPWECALHSSQALKTPTLLLQGSIRLSPTCWVTMISCTTIQVYLEWEDGSESSKAVASLPIWWSLWTHWYIFSSYIRSLWVLVTQVHRPMLSPVYKV